LRDFWRWWGRQDESKDTEAHRQAGRKGSYSSWMVFASLQGLAFLLQASRLPRKANYFAHSCRGSYPTEDAKEHFRASWAKLRRI